MIYSSEKMSRKLCVHLEPKNVTLFRSRVSAKTRIKTML